MKVHVLFENYDAIIVGEFYFEDDGLEMRDKYEERSDVIRVWITYD